MVIGSSGLPPPVISCMSAFPMEVARSVTCIDFPSISACGGTVVTWPSQAPARVFSLSKDFCASDWAKDIVQSDNRTTDSAKPIDFTFSISLEGLMSSADRYRLVFRPHGNRFRWHDLSYHCYS